MNVVVSRDFISKLSDDLLGHVLSFLDTKDAASTSILSKRWRYLLASVPILDLGDDHNRSRSTLAKAMSFKVFVDRVLALQEDAPLQKFALTCTILSNPSFVDGWIKKALERGVLDLELDITPRYHHYVLPPRIFTSNTLVTLKVDGNTIDVREEVSLPNLKTLRMVNVDFYEDEGGLAFAKLISSCHVLEELVVVKSDLWESFSVSNPNVKTVTIRSDNRSDNPTSVSFDTPNMISFELTDVVAVEYPKVNFDSLVEAKLELRVASHEHKYARDCIENGIEWAIPVGIAENASEDLLKGISNVKTLYIASNTLEVLNFCCKEIPVFNNLIHLTIQTDEEIQWASLPSLLEKSPNLETLVFQGLFYREKRDIHRYIWKKSIMSSWDIKEEGESFLSSSPVKVLRIFRFGEISKYKNREMKLIEFFVGTMPNLEHLIIYYDTLVEDDARAVLTAILRYRKIASTKCRIKVIAVNVTLSSTVPSSGSKSGRNRF